jgi:uncharacterized protein YraI
LFGRVLHMINGGKSDKLKLPMEKNMKKLLLFSMIYVVFVISCQLFGMTQQSAITQTPIVAPAMTLLPSPIVTVEFTSTPIPPILSALAEVPCRVGPGDLYDFVVTLQPGEKVNVVGKAEAYWIVIPQVGAECWVSYDQVNIEGDVSTLPIVAAPPTPTPAIPAAPAHVGLINQKCSIDHSTKPIMYVSQFRLKWTDMSYNEDGFRVYRDGDLVAEVAANTTDVTDVVSRRNKRVYSYYVTAYNEVGESKSEVVAFSCGK